MPVDAVCNDWRCTALVSFLDDFLRGGGGGITSGDLPWLRYAGMLAHCF